MMGEGNTTMPTRETAKLVCTNDAAEFEMICQAVLCTIYQREEHATLPSSELFRLEGRNGQNQHGIDLCSTIPLGERQGFVVAQCKNYHNSTAQKLKKAADADIGRIAELELGISEIIIMTSLSRDSSIQNHYRRLLERKRKDHPDYPGIRVLFWEDIAHYILLSDELMNRFYRDFQVEKSIVIYEDGHMNTYNEWKKVQMEAFHKADAKINELLPDKIVNSKTDQLEEFRIEKIINSLLGLGIPMTVCFEIAETTANEVYESLLRKTREERRFSTAKIRKSVSMAIQEISNSECTKEDIEKWTNRYARRYGHNNQCLEVYYPNQPDRPKDQLNYEFIRGEFLDAVIEKIVPGAVAEKEISPKARQAMAEEILAFINQCDLYQINFDLMVNMIAEIATQPPHPWMGSNDLRQENLKYNARRIEENLQKLDRVCRKNKPVPQSILLEILHHSATLILCTHNYYFGCYDMSAVYRLKDILSYFQNVQNHEITRLTVWDDAIERTKLSGLLTDLMLAQVSPKDLYDLLGKIANQVSSNRQNTSAEFIGLTRDLAACAKQIYYCSTREEIQNFLISDWSEFSRDRIVQNVQTIFWTLFPVIRYKHRIPPNNHFGVRYLVPSIGGYPQGYIKNMFLLIVGLDPDMSLGFLNMLTEGNKKCECNTIVLITETEEEVKALKQNVGLQMQEYHIEADYRILTIVKEDLAEMMETEDKIEWFEKMYFGQMDDDRYDEEW